MATAKQITALLKSHSKGDGEAFKTVALQIAANEARKGHNHLAAQIQKIISGAGFKSHRVEASEQKSTVQPIVFSRPEGELGNLLEIVETKVRLSHMVLENSLRERLHRIVREQKSFNQLREHGLFPRQRILLMGPPGCGKTMTASALSGEMGMPLFVVRLDALFTKFLGETAAKLRLVFEAIEKSRGIFLFDEFDSLGLARGSQHDVAEMRRVLNTFLVLIENMKGHSMVIAASNHPDSLDSALFRRFDDLIQYGMPQVKELESLIKNRIAGMKKAKIAWTRIRPMLAGLSYADAARIADEAMKEVIIDGAPELETQNLIVAIHERKSFRNE
jgi:SpoVK/Ycf46/Vps4 family AAA+-type ATPase